MYISIVQLNENVVSEIIDALLKKSITIRENIVLI